MKKISRPRKQRKLVDLPVSSRRKKGIDVAGGRFDPFLKMETVEGELRLK